MFYCLNWCKKNAGAIIVFYVKKKEKLLIIAVTGNWHY